MVSKFAAMQKQLEQAGGSKRGATIAPEPVAVAPPVPTIKAKAPSREGKIHIGAYLNPDFKRSFLLYPGGTVPPMGLQLINRRKVQRVVRVDPITGVPRVETAPPETEP